MNAPYQLFEPLTDEEYAALKADIAERGILVPVEVDEDGTLLDGHHRVRAWQELRSEGIVLPDYPRLVRAGMTEEQKREHARVLNLMRRHLSEEQREPHYKRWIGGRTIRSGAWPIYRCSTSKEATKC